MAVSVMGSIPALKDTQLQLKTRMEKAVDDFRATLASTRTGRASVHMLDQVKVPYYGSDMPLNQVAQVTAPDANLILIQPWDPSIIGDIEKALRASDLGFNPQNDGKIIRIPIPQLTEERRKELVKHVKKIAEEYRVSVRNHRRVALEHLKEAEKNKEITADDAKHGHDRVQKATDDFIGRIDKIVKAKEEEVMAV